jgi:hypothetical protein
MAGEYYDIKCTFPDGNVSTKMLNIEVIAPHASIAMLG